MNARTIETASRWRGAPRLLRTLVRKGLRRIREKWAFGRTEHGAALLRYAAGGEHELCEAALPWEGAAEPLRLQLLRSGDRYEYRIRCERTLRHFFGHGAPINRDGLGPFVRIRAEPGLSGAVASSLPAGAAAGLAPLHRFCVETCAALARHRDPRAAALAARLAQLGRHPC